MSGLSVPAPDAAGWVPAEPVAESPSLRQADDAFVVRAARRLWWLLVDLCRLLRREPELMIDLKRVNVELRRVAPVGPDDDIGYRERVKHRIREGARCTLPPLIDRKWGASVCRAWDQRVVNPSPPGLTETRSTVMRSARRTR